MVRTHDPIFFRELHDFGPTARDRGGEPKGIFNSEKSGQFLVRTHVRKYVKFLRF
jgi:hypothetical protein